jgi:hypothetical protein
MIVVLRPYKHVYLQQQSSEHAFEDGGASEREQKNKRMFIREMDPRSFINADENFQMMTIEEHTRTRIKEFHICDAYDIASIKAHQDFQGLYEEDKSEESTSLFKQGANKAHYMPGSLQVINFIKTKLSYEYSSKEIKEEKFAQNVKLD